MSLRPKKGRVALSILGVYMVYNGFSQGSSVLEVVVRHKQRAAKGFIASHNLLISRTLFQILDPQ